jgi:DNA adenine methylase
MSHQCEKCLKVFSQKSGLTTHLKRKTPCKNNTTLHTIIDQKIKEATDPLRKEIAELKSIPVNEIVYTSPISIPLTNIVKPFLKWVGGKTQILDDVLCLYPREIQSYHEPFLGGGSVLLGLLSQIKSGKIKVNGTLYASDLNQNLIALYKNVQEHCEDLIAVLKIRVEIFNKITGTTVNRDAKTLEEASGSQESFYYFTRYIFNKMTKEERASIVGSATFIFLNKTCFRGVYREGPNGFNVPFGHYKNPGILDEAHIRQVSLLVKDVVFTCQPFTDSLSKVSSGDFVYLDPPYAPENDKSFVGYTADGFALKEHQALFKGISDLHTKGVKLLMSNAEVKLVKDAFPEPVYKTKIVSCRRAINSKDPAAKTNEVLIRN